MRQLYFECKRCEEGFWGVNRTVDLSRTEQVAVNSLVTIFIGPQRQWNRG